MAVQPRKIRARGANAKMRLAIAANYGEIPETGYVLLPFVSSAIGEEQPLLPDDTLGHGREMEDPTYDVITDTGDIVVPNDARNLWYWLKMAFGAPTSTPSVAASGSFDFSAQPAANSTVTINAVVITFVAANAVGPQVLIGANLPATLVALQAMLAASATAGIASQTYAVDGNSLTVTSKTLGVAGNSVALAAGDGSNATPSGDTLSGGAVDHVFTSGAQDIPDAAIEIGHEDVGTFTTNFGAKVNQLKFAMQRSGLSTVTCSMICKGETDPVGVSADPDADDLGQLRFTNAGGSLLVDGVQTGNIKSADCTISNELEPVDTIEEDGRIGGADPGNISNTGSMTVLYDSDDMANRARKRKPCEIQYKWKTPAGYALTIVFQRAFLPVTKKSITGPKGITRSYNWTASGAQGASVVVTLRNDVAAY